MHEEELKFLSEIEETDFNELERRLDEESIQLQPILDAIENIPSPQDCDFDLMVRSAAKPSSKIAVRPTTTLSKHTTIRFPADVIEAYEKRAAATGIRYQTLMIEALRGASLKW